MEGTRSQNADQDKRKLLFISNRWINTAYSGYGIIKQRILLEVLHQLQDRISMVMNGKTVASFNMLPGYCYPVDIDMSNIVHFNNYHQVRKSVKQMCSTPIQIYNDPSYKQPIYFSEPLFNSSEPGTEKKILKIFIRKEIMELLLHVKYERTKESAKKVAQQYTSFDKTVINRLMQKGVMCRYTYPLYTMICSYANKGGFTIDVDQFRRRLDVEAKYKGFDNMHRFVIKHVQKELEVSGDYKFNYTLVKNGRTVKQIIFKVISNKKYDPNHAYVRIVQALTTELPYFARLTEHQRETFNYLLNGDHDLDEVLKKVHKIHDNLVKRKQEGREVLAVALMAYIRKSLHEQFPPG